MQWDAWITSVYFSSSLLEEGNSKEHFIGIISNFMHTWPSVICFGRHHRNHIIQFLFLQVFSVFYLFFLRQRVYFISENAICGEIFFKPLQKTNSLYLSASAFFISRQLIPTEETVGQGRIWGSVPSLFSAFLGETWHILLQPDVWDVPILVPAKSGSMIWLIHHY